MTIARCSLGPDKARWPDQKAAFKGLDVRVTAFIEDVGWRHSQVDFANKMIGGTDARVSSPDIPRILASVTSATPLPHPFRVLPLQRYR